MAEKRTTQPPRINVEAFFPELFDFRKNAVRLFPRPKLFISVNNSKLGGNIIWPEEESWPYCPVHNVPFVALIQLTKKDVPELGFKQAMDVFQILWCPHSHNECDCLPAHRIYWRDSAQVKQSLSSIPDIVVNEKFIPTDSGEFIPTQCCFYPERIVEYPGYEELPQNLQEKLTQWNILDIPGIDELGENWDNVPFGPGGWFYNIELSVSGGTKIGGYPEWIQYPDYPVCSCGKTMEHLLSISSLETVLGNPTQRWIPLEEKHLSEDERYGLHYGTKLMFGDGGIVYIFICRSCEAWPIKFVWQCG
jgi:hypothetical protein